MSDGNTVNPQKNEGQKTSHSVSTAIKATEDFIRRLHSELLKSLSDKSFLVEGTLRLVQGVMITGHFVDELNVLEDKIFDIVRKRAVISKVGAEALLHKAIGAAVLFERLPAPLDQFKNQLKMAMQELYKEVTRDPGTWTYLIRVGGFHAQSLPIKIGKVQFRLMTEEEFSKLETDIESATAKTLNTDDEKGLMNEDLRNGIRHTYSNHVGAILDVNAIDGEAAVDLALREVRKTLDTINFFTSNEHPPIHGTHFTWEGRGSHEQFLGIQKEWGMIVHNRVQGVAIPADLREIRKIPAFSKASDLLAQDKYNKFQKRLLSAMQWAGRASIQELIDQAFLFYAISLENLLLGTKGESELSYRLSIYGAYLLGHDGKSRKEVHQTLKKLYTLRSQIVHAGSAAIRESDLTLIRRYAKRAVLTFLTDERFSNMSSEEDVDEFFKAQVLGCSTANLTDDVA